MILKFIAKGPRLFRQMIRSFLWQRILSCRGLQLGDHALIIGEKYISLGENFRAGRGLWLEAVAQYRHQSFKPSLRIGERFSASDWVHIACAFDLYIGDDVLIGSKVHITDHNHGSYHSHYTSDPEDPPSCRQLSGGPVRIGNSVFLADGVIVLPGSDIGDGAIVGANSVVRGLLPGNTIYAGIPAKPIKRFEISTRSWIPIKER